MLTKGEPAEQAAKVERSGLQPHFDHIEIVLEKDSSTYGRMIEQFKIVMLEILVLWPILTLPDDHSMLLQYMSFHPKDKYVLWPSTRVLSCHFQQHEHMSFHPKNNHYLLPI